jgi:hypothetical protein
MRRATALGVVWLLALVAATTSLPASASTASDAGNDRRTKLAAGCSAVADVERQADNDVGSYHAVGCTPQMYRIRVRMQAINCKSTNLNDCHNPLSDAYVIYDTWKQCFNTTFCRGRRVLADGDAPPSYYCVLTKGVIEKTKYGDVIYTDTPWKCELKG